MGNMGVGKAEDGKIFVAVPDGYHEPLKSCLTEQGHHAIKMDADDAAWLIVALAKEIDGDAAREAAYEIRKMHCPVCDGTTFDPDTLDGLCECCSDPPF